MNFANILAGKLSLTSEIPLSAPTISYLLRTNHLKKQPSIIKKYFHYQCCRCGNKSKHLFAMIPCARCEQEHLYCRRCLQTARVLACEPLLSWNGDKPRWRLQTDPCRWQGELTEQQQTAATAIKEAIAYAKKELLVWAVCGAGKTEMLFPAITEAIQTNKRICLATPRADVVRELFPRMQSAFPHTEIEALYADSSDRTDVGQFIISTTHQLIRYHDAFDVMIIDEIDAFPFHHDQTLSFLADRACKQAASKIYLTATPRSKQKRAISSKKLDVQFVPIRFHGQPLPVPQLQIEWQLRKKLDNGKQPHALTKFIKNRSDRRQLLLFVPTIARMKTVAPFFQAVSVHADDPERKEKIAQFRKKEIDILVTTTILERGVTFPSVDVVVIDAGHHVFDEAALVQIAGRAGRSPDDPTGEVMFIHQGKTNSMEAAVDQIKMMNKKGSIL
ncbi:DEAD/DEAH box helicase family protein [Gracilibacillus caseinilyticus]|uniref:DEAD/DEAH box helicase family protein n=1 Tax=Gracilibacillus caseinilyticus TaxID=2932256 RepID=A0ABY4EVP7_9BACI|nr:helicase-related protein [Gracilibacillus caseinilyticus]UOQ48313.1 DEAD/DEAH box helicase family protein [Gracilibacillus caseinilyticus]